MAYTYIDFVTKKVRKTNGVFSCWTRGGLMGGPGVAFSTRCMGIFIPEYLLTSDTLSKIPPKPESMQVQNRPTMLAPDAATPSSAGEPS